MGTTYLLHFDGAYFHARHYLGWTKRAEAETRVAEHLASAGSPLVRAALAGGCTVELVRTWAKTTRTDERALKNRKNARELCPRCGPQYRTAARERMRAHRARRKVT